MREGWTCLKLAACIEKTPAVSKIPKKLFLAEGPFPVVSQEQNLVNGRWDNEGDVLKIDAPILVYGDHTQIIKFIDFDFVVGADGVKLLKAKPFLDPRYFYYYLLGNPVKRLGYARHYRLLRELDILFPPVNEQKHIVAILDEAFEGIDTAIVNTERNLANARELFASYLNSVFDDAPEEWLVAKLSDICTIKHGFAFKSDFFSTEGPYVVLTPGSFFERGGFRDQGAKTKYYVGEVPAGYILREGDFLIAMTEQAAGLLGSSLVVPQSDRYLHNQRLGLVQVRDGVEWCNDFFFHQFNTSSFRAAVQRTAAGAKVRHTSPSKLGEVLVKYPLMKLDQERVAMKLNELSEEIQRLESIYQQKLAALAELKQSLLQKAFSGELTAGFVEVELACHDEVSA